MACHAAAVGRLADGAAVRLGQAGHDVELIHVTRPTEPDKLAAAVAALRDQGLEVTLLTGDPAVGKSELALDLITRGSRLVGDSSDLAR